MVIFMPVYVNGKQGGWEGRYIRGETASALEALVKELPEGREVAISGLLLNEFPHLTAWWLEASKELDAREALEKVEHEAKEARAWDKQMMVRRRLLGDDIISSP